jgi:ABC-type multidrug transport system ATPase subunit
MQVRLQVIGKKFNTDWIFRNLTFSFEPNSATAILGRNGSGKSTLLQVIAGNIHPTEGAVVYILEGKNIPPDRIFRHISMAAPYLELVEDFTLAEMLRFHFSFKKILPGHDHDTLTKMLSFNAGRNKQIRQFSSGMKQRLKLLLAVMSDVELLLLDEPTVNLDSAGIAWYHELLQRYAGNRTLVICTNQPQTESPGVDLRLEIEQFKIVTRDA